MVTAVLLIDDFGPHRARCIALLAKRFSLSLREVRKSAEHGEPVVTGKLFDRLDPSFADRFAEALAELEALECRRRAFEVSDGEIWTSPEGCCQLTAERLRNMIAAHRTSLAYQRWVGALQDPDPDET
jgi:hypothetical protein